MSDKKISKYRNAFESSTEWGLRRKFLKVHHDKFDEDRLVCLSMCYVNIEVYGCTYPAPVMKCIQRLKAELK
uniref:XRN2-binding (XTBD) domain-containing protein n=1 Tax=Octopus bimaculoides TaxID=37653 RepID=A0A0L8HDB8_OCTBM